MTKAMSTAGLREELSLDGAWAFRLEGQTDWRTAMVPNPWQAEHADLRHSTGTALYRRTIAVPTHWAGRQVVVHFGAVNYLAEIRLDGQLIGSHEGGYLPFEIVLPAGVTGDHELEVKATLPSGDSAQYPDAPFGEIPHGKQSWYGPLGGIWQSVKLVARDARHISHVGITTDIATGKAQFRVSAAVAGLSFRVSLAGEVAEGAGPDLSVTLSAPKLWSPDHPHLYTARIEALAGGVVVDAVSETFGFRKIETRGGKFYLNGEPLYMRGALDQDYYPEGICTPPSLAFLEDQFRKAKQLGLNLLRCHIKVPDPRYHEVADRLGLLIWTEIPNVQYFSAKAAARMRETMAGIVARDGNHPSIIAWTLINEDWGTRLVENADHRQWLKDTYDWLKALDPDRLVVDNSACIPNFHVKTDINDYHYYRSVPERRAEWEQLTTEFDRADAWTWSHHGDGERRGDEPLVVSEFGVWGLPQPEAVGIGTSDEPWWAETGGNWGDGAAYPHGIANRFKTYHLDKVFGSLEGFVTAAQWYQHANLKYEIESMRARPNIQGYVITEMTDVHWEANGLLDIRRNPRVFHNRFAEVNTDTVIVPQIDRHALYGGSSVALSLKIATGGRAIPAATLKWTVEGKSGTINVPATGALSVADIGLHAIPVAAGAARVAVIELVLEAGGQRLSRNEIAVSVYAARTASTVKLAASGKLADHLKGLGFALVPSANADLIVTHALAEDDIEAMRSGRRYLVLADGSVPTHRNLRIDPPRAEPPTMPNAEENARHLGAETQLPNLGLVKRDGTLWRGDWIANFSWIRRDGAFKALPGGAMLDVSFDRVVPHHVLTGFRSWEYDGLVDAGVVIGWIQKPAATIARRKVGKGGLVATTFRLLNDAPGADPVATALLDGLVAVGAGLPQG